MSYAHRITHLKPEGAYAVLARAQALEAQGREIIHLEIGQPDFDTYPHIALAGIRAIATGQTRYNPPGFQGEIAPTLRCRDRRRNCSSRSTPWASRSCWCC